MKIITRAEAIKQAEKDFKNQVFMEMLDSTPEGDDEAEREMGTGRSAVWAVLSGRRKTVHNYSFKYLNKEELI